MSYVGVIVQEFAAHIFADGASTTGRPVTKIWPMAHADAIVACRGPISSNAIVPMFLGAAARSFDELALNAVDAFHEALKEVSRIDGEIREAEVYCAGLSSAGPAAFAIFSNGQKTGEKPFKNIEIPHYLFAPKVKNVFDGDAPFDDSAMIRIGDAWRDLPESERAGFRAGEFVQATSIFDGGDIVTRIVKRWP
jgi:hypothetical protein